MTADGSSTIDFTMLSRSAGGVVGIEHTLDG